MTHRRSRRRYYRREDETLEGILINLVPVITIPIAFYLVYLYLYDKPKFWYWIWWGIAVVVGLFVAAFLINITVQRRKEKKLRFLLQAIKEKNLDSAVQNFIANSLGLTKQSGVSTEYKGYHLSEDRLSNLVIFLNQKGIKMNRKWLGIVLTRLIDEREMRFDVSSFEGNPNETRPRSLSNLSGSDFENLLVRLYDAMGYQARRIGGTGDQGGDVIANKDGERLLIQAKRWSNNVGNEAVQQAIAAKGFHNCTSAAVVTTSDFTREAVDLAKVHGVQLIRKPVLQRMLSEYLKENWSV